MKRKDERGALVVEASIVFPVMFLIIFFMIYTGNAYLQKCRVESIISQCAIDGAAYCADPLLQSVEGGGIPDLNSLEVYPYRAFSSTGVGNIEGQIAGQIESRVANMGSGLFAGMKPTNFVVSTNYTNGILYATFSVDASYKIMNPVRLLGERENIFLEVSTHVEMPVSDSSELIRNIDMIMDYLDRWFNASEQIQKMVTTAKGWFD